MRYFNGVVFGLGFWFAFPCATQADSITFQGLSGSSTWQEVQKTFPVAHATRDHQCGPKDHRTRAGWDCTELEVTNYDILGMKFDVNFIFDGSSHRLLAVTLFHSWAALNSIGVPKSDVTAQYDMLRDGLTSSHGAPSVKWGCLSKDDGEFFTLCDVWRGMPNDVLSDSMGKIELEADGIEGAPDSYTGYFQIAYLLKPQFKGL